MTIYIELGKKIKILRVKHNLTQEELSSCADISTHFLSKIENGIEKSSLETVYKIARALKIPTADLFSAQVPTTTTDLSDNKIAAIIKTLDPKKKKLALEIFKDIVIKLRKF